MTTFKVIEERSNPLFKRKTVVAEISYPKKATPSTSEIVKEATSFFKTKEDSISVKKIEQKYGKATSAVTFNVYENEKDLKAAESINKKQQNKKGDQQSGKGSETKK